MVVADSGGLVKVRWFLFLAVPQALMRTFLR